ncbi:MAG: DNA mismatch repair protein MutS, partial [Clostridia bacterium]|nr:DNA mismatch repair protein MutS [Clostridia bacterium]
MAELSPMMRQYFEIKNQHEDCILFYRVGDFYEMFFDDAKTASEELDLVLTGKECGQEERAPMCGVPFHSCEGYIARLIGKGYKVAICEQTEDPAKAKGLVKREVIRIVTPGTVIEDTVLDETRNNYLAAIGFFGETAGLCFVDASTGACSVTEIAGDDRDRRIVNELMRFSPSELLTDDDFATRPALAQYVKQNFEGALTVRPKTQFEPTASEELLQRYFQIVSTENIGLQSGSIAVGVVGAALQYLFELGINGGISAQKIEYYTETQYMRLDMTAIRNLELCATMRSKAKKGSLLWVLDKTKTAMGKRLMRSWIEKPLLSVSEISLRQNAVEELCDTMLRGELTEYLSGVRDVERLMARIAYGTAGARDLLALSVTAHKFPLIKAALATANWRMLKGICEDIDPLESVVDLIDRAISEDAPISVREGGMIKRGYNAELDLARSDMESGTDFLTEIETRERERTGIRNLKVSYNKVFGYYIEVSNSFKDKVPPDYIRKQTLTNAERFITDELKKIETRVLSAKDRSVQMEYELFDEVRKAAAAELLRFQKTASAIARLDVLCSLSETAVQNNYCRPLVNNSGVLNIKGGRHPVVEQMINTPFVANNTFLDQNDNRCAIITGP